jgi:hypothetical protein
MTIQQTAIYSNVPKYISQYYYADKSFTAKTVSVAADRYTLTTPSFIGSDIGGTSLDLIGSVNIDLSIAANWDSQTPTDYTVAANRAGKDFYVYGVWPRSGNNALKLLVSPNATYPSGYTASNSRKISGFPCVYVDYGTISGHPLSGYLAGDIIPNGVWDLKFRSESGANEGLAYDDEIKMWGYLYMASQASAGVPASVAGGTIWDTITWNDAVDAGRAVKMRLPFDAEFQSMAALSNEGTNIFGSADPGTTGGHVDTAGRRMVSKFGYEDMCGVEYHWLGDQSFRYDASSAFSWLNVVGSKGRLYNEGLYDVKLLAGGVWSYGGYCGSRSRAGNYFRWYAYSIIGVRLVARSVER